MDYIYYLSQVDIKSYVEKYQIVQVGYSIQEKKGRSTTHRKALKLDGFNQASHRLWCNVLIELPRK